MEHTSKKETTSNFNQDYFKSRFKKKLFGGYDPSEVIDFINAMHNNFENSEQNLRRNMVKFTQDKQKIECEMESFRAEKDKEISEVKIELETVLQELNEKKRIMIDNEAAVEEFAHKLNEAAMQNEELMLKTYSERSVLEASLRKETEKNYNLISQMNTLEEEIERLQLQIMEMEKQNDTSYLDEKADQIKMEAFEEVNEEKRINAGLQHEIKAMQNRMAEIEKTNETLSDRLYEEKHLRMTLEDQLNEEKKKYSDLQMNGFKKEFNEIQLFLEEFTIEQESRNKELELQLELEREKSEKAEERIQNLLTKYGALKDKVLWEKKQFMSKLSELADGHSKFVTDLNMVLTEVTPFDSKEVINR